MAAQITSHVDGEASASKLREASSRKLYKGRPMRQFGNPGSPLERHRR